MIFQPSPKFQDLNLNIDNSIPTYQTFRRTQIANLMHDPRIVRGNTYAAIVSNKSNSQFKKDQPLLKLKTQKKRQQSKQKAKFEFDSGFQPTTPRAVDGRQHFSIQTQAFVQTLRDKPIEYEKECQTDFYLDRPVQRLFKPIKTGTDYATQIEEGDPELFDFDYEVQPILDALLSKVLDTSRMEIFEQQELQEKVQKKIQYERTKNAVLAETQKLQSNELRLHQQQQRRQLQFKKVKQQSSFAEKKLIGRVLSKQYLKNLKRNTYMILDEQGFFRQPLEVDLYNNFLPWLYQEINSELENRQNLQSQVKNLLHQFGINEAKKHEETIQQEKMKKQAQIKRKQDEKEKKRIQKIRKLEEQQRKKLQQQQALQQNAQIPSQ